MKYDKEKILTYLDEVWKSYLSKHYDDEHKPVDVIDIDFSNLDEIIIYYEQLNGNEQYIITDLLQIEAYLGE